MFDGIDCLPFESPIDTNALIQMMGELGREGDGVHEQVSAWIEAVDAFIESSRDPTHKLLRNVWLARLFLAAGWLEEAAEQYRDALWQAENEHEEQLFWVIKAEMTRQHISFEADK